MATIFNPTITEQGLEAAFNAENTGVELALTHVAFGTGQYTPIGDEEALVNEVKRVPIAAGSRITPNQIRITAIWSSDLEASPISEIGFYADDLLFAVWSRDTGGPLGFKTAGVDFVLPYDWKLSAIPANTITVIADSGQSALITLLGQHENDQNAHPQYLKRSEFAEQALGLTGCTVAGTANDLVLTTPVESVITAYAQFQSFRFVASSNNTGAVTVNVDGLGVKDVRKNGDDALSADDIQGGAVYDLIYDGARFQIAGGVGSAASSETFEFVAVSGQTEFAVAHDGAVQAHRNGRLIAPSDLDVSDTTKLVMPACNDGDEVVIEVIATFSVANTYSRSEVEQLIDAASVLPLGYFSGFAMANNSVSPVTTIDVGSGQARSSDDAYDIKLLSTIRGVLQSSGSWSSGDNENKLDAGARANNTWYHVFAIRRTSDGAGDILFSTSATSPTMPSGYAGFRRIGAIRTDGSGNILSFLNVGCTFYWGVLTQDVAASGVASPGTINLTLRVPTGVPVEARLNAMIRGENCALYIRPPGTTAPTLAGGGSGTSWIAGIGQNADGSTLESMSAQVDVITNSSGQVILQNFAGTGNNAYVVTTLSYKELR